MKTRTRCLTSLLLAALTLVSTGGCITPRSLSSDAVSYNLAVEQAQNRVLLLNVLRAENRYPMYLTAISSIAGSVSAELSAGLELPFGGDAKSTFKATPGATYKVAPTMDLAVLDTQEFMKGFLSPVESEVFAYYIHQGWHQEQLLHLLVRKIEIELNDGGSGNGRWTATNYPDVSDSALCEWKAFATVVRWLVENKLETRSVTVPVSPILSDLDDLAAIVAAAKEGVIVEDEKSSDAGSAPDCKSDTKGGSKTRCGAEEGRYKLSRAEKRIQLSVQKHPKGCPIQEIMEQVGSDCWEKLEGWIQSGKNRSDETSGAGVISVKTTDDQLGFRLYLRSPEAVLYYLGELVRVAEAGKKLPLVCIHGKWEPLFFARKRDDGCREGVVQTEYLSAQYLIPASQGDGEQPWARWLTFEEGGERACHDTAACTSGEWSVADWTGDGKAVPCLSGRSMHSLSLLSQLFALHKSAEDLPSTSLVRIVGQ